MCTVHPDLKHMFDKCIGVLSTTNEVRESFDTTWQQTGTAMPTNTSSSPWKYHFQEVLIPGFQFPRQVRGYRVVLDPDYMTTVRMLQSLKESKWFDEYSHQFVIELVAYNSGLNSASLVYISVDLLPVGGAEINYEIRVISLYQAHGGYKWTLVVIHSGLMSFALLTLFVMLKNLVLWKCRHFVSLANVNRFLLIIFISANTTLCVLREERIRSLSLNSSDVVNQSLSLICAYDAIIAFVLSMIGLTVAVYVLEIAEIIPSIKIILRTFKATANDMFHLSISLLLVFLTCTSSICLIVCSSDENFSDFIKTFFTLFSELLCEYNSSKYELYNELPVAVLLMLSFVSLCLIRALFYAVLQTSYSNTMQKMKLVNEACMLVKNRIDEYYSKVAGPVEYNCYEPGDAMKRECFATTTTAIDTLETRQCHRQTIPVYAIKKLVHPEGFELIQKSKFRKISESANEFYIQDFCGDLFLFETLSKRTQQTKDSSKYTAAVAEPSLAIPHPLHSCFHATTVLVKDRKITKQEENTKMLASGVRLEKLSHRNNVGFVDKLLHKPVRISGRIADASANDAASYARRHRGRISDATGLDAANDASRKASRGSNASAIDAVSYARRHRGIISDATGLDADNDANINAGRSSNVSAIDAVSYANRHRGIISDATGLDAANDANINAGRGSNASANYAASYARRLRGSISDATGLDAATGASRNTGRSFDASGPDPPSKAKRNTINTADASVTSDASGIHAWTNASGNTRRSANASGSDAPNDAKRKVIPFKSKLTGISWSLGKCQALLLKTRKDRIQEISKPRMDVVADEMIQLFKERREHNFTKTDANVSDNLRYNARPLEQDTRIPYESSTRPGVPTSPAVSHQFTADPCSILPDHLTPDQHEPACRPVITRSVSSKFNIELDFGYVEEGTEDLL